MIKPEMDSNIYERVELLKLKEKLLFTKRNQEKLNIDAYTLKNYLNWYLADNKYYYFKELDTKKILNNLICEKVAGKFNLESAHFIPALAKDNKTSKYGLASVNFRKKDASYFYASDILDYHTLSATLIFNKNLKKPFTDMEIAKILRLIAFHIYTDLKDTGSGNLLFQKDGDYFKLAPIYDFDYSFNARDTKYGVFRPYLYNSYICSMMLPSKETTKLLTWYPCLRENLKSFLDIDMAKILKDLIENENLNIPINLYDHYLRQDEIKKQLVRSNL